MPIVHPYENLSGQWLRGNLHTHTTNSDGKRPPQAVIDDYAARGYGFLMLSDHDVYTSPEMLAALDNRGLVLIPGNEISARGPHMLHVNCNQRIEPDRQRQTVIDQANQAGGFIIVNHPNWEERFSHCPQELMEQWQNYAGLEIYNGVIGRLDGSQYALDRWDMLLSAGRRVWGYANDDCHRETGDIELGWNVVNVPQRTVAAVVNALQTGRFYTSTGVVINRLQVNGNRIRIETENAQRIVAMQQVGKRFAIADASSIEVEVPEGAKYVRFECWGGGETFAWTQPFFVE